MIIRTVTPHLLKAAQELPVVAIIGPRQSGKTTLAKASFPSHRYLSLEDLDLRAAATNDPRTFLQDYSAAPGVILDEIQHVPTLLSYIQTYVDEQQKPGFFILTGSQNFLVGEAISQTLAGRIAIITLLPLAIEELAHNNLLPNDIESVVFKGGYPRLYAQAVEPVTWYPDYLLTYVERDVRSIKQVADLSLFKTFMSLCAGRIGQLLNISSLANDCGISTTTAHAWLSLLEASYIIYLLRPHYKNFSKRLVKSPKLYFYDTGLACSLLDIENEQQLASHYLRGGLVESLLITELFKQFYNIRRQPHLYFWRDNRGNEVDCIIERGQQLTPVEIKSSRTVASDYFDGIKYWNELAKNSAENSFALYAGNDNQKRQNGRILSWRSIDELIAKK